jgi:hypothetical protein
MKKSLLVILVIFLLSSQFVFARGEQETEVQKYVNEELGFSFTFPAECKEEPPQSQTELKRFSHQNEIKIPVYTATLREQMVGVQLKEIPNRVMDSMASSIPGTSGFSILKAETMKLGDGSEGIHFQFEWTWVDGETVMQSVFTGGFKGEKLIMISGTTIRDFEIPLEELARHCNSLKLSL